MNTNGLRAEVRGPRPSAVRIAVVVTVAALTHVLLVALAHGARSTSPSAGAVLATVLGAGASAIFIGSVGEWLGHRFIMHRRWKPALLRVIYDLHHRGHHFIHFTPQRYVHDGPINYIPVWPPQPEALCRSAASRWLSMSAQFVFYGSVALMVVLLPTALAARNLLFTVVFSATIGVEIVLFVRLHDAVHYPGQSWLERLPFFTRLDRHHYIHHIDPRANTNFLLPLGDLLCGTLRRSVTSWEGSRFPSYDDARKSRVSEADSALVTVRAA